MSKHSQDKRGSGPLPYAVAMLLGAAGAGVAWLYLVNAAIDFSGVALSGELVGWLFMLAPSLGAVLCMLLMLTMVARALVALGIISDYKPRRSAGRRRLEK